MHTVSNRPSLDELMRRLKGTSASSFHANSIIEDKENMVELQRTISKLHTTIDELSDQKNALEKELLKTKKNLENTQKEKPLEPFALLHIAEQKIAEYEKILRETPVNKYQTLLLENEQLRKERSVYLENEKSSTNDRNANVIQMALTCRKLEDEIHTLSCEKAAIAKQLRETKESFSDYLEQEQVYKNTIKKLEDTAAKNQQILQEKEQSIASLQEQCHHLENELSGERTLIKNTLDQFSSQAAFLQHLDETHTLLQQAHTESLTQISILTTELAHFKEENAVLTTTINTLSNENQQIRSHAEETNTVLANRLAYITEIQEQIDLLKTMLHTVHVHNESLLLEKQELNTTIKGLQESFSSLQNTHNQLQKAFDEKKCAYEELEVTLSRYAAFEKIVQEARPMVSALIKTLKMQQEAPVTVTNLMQELNSRQTDNLGIYVGDRFEQHDLF